jgi:hypothetical protein
MWQKRLLRGSPVGAQHVFRRGLAVSFIHRRQKKLRIAVHGERVDEWPRQLNRGLRRGDLGRVTAPASYKGVIFVSPNFRTRTVAITNRHAVWSVQPTPASRLDSACRQSYFTASRCKTQNGITLSPGFYQCCKVVPTLMQTSRPTSHQSPLQRAFLWLPLDAAFLLQCTFVHHF